MTRVDKINESIRYLYVNKGYSIKEIRQELLNYDVDLSLFELLGIIQNLNYVYVKERKKTVRQQRLDKFKPCLVKLMVLAEKYKMNNADIVAYFRHHGIQYPSRRGMDRPATVRYTTTI